MENQAMFMKRLHDMGYTYFDIPQLTRKEITELRLASTMETLVKNEKRQQAKAGDDSKRNYDGRNRRTEPAYTAEELAEEKYGGDV